MRKTQSLMSGCRAALLMMMLTVGAPAFAGGGLGPIVFDPSNFSQNTITAAQTVKMVAQQVQAYVLQLKQYQTELQNLIPTSAADLAGLAWNTKELGEAMKFAGELQSLYGTLQQAKSAVDLRINEARTLNMSWPQYQSLMSRQISDGSAYQKQRLDNERRILQRVQGDYEAASTFASRISGTEGIHESVGLMNAQMNRMLVQNAQVIELLGVTLPQSQNRAYQQAMEKKATSEGTARTMEDIFQQRRTNSINGINSLGR